MTTASVRIVSSFQVWPSLVLVCSQAASYIFFKSSLFLNPWFLFYVTILILMCSELQNFLIAVLVMEKSLLVLRAVLTLLTHMVVPSPEFERLCQLLSRNYENAECKFSPPKT